MVSPIGLPRDESITPAAPISYILNIPPIDAEFDLFVDEVQQPVQVAHHSPPRPLSPPPYTWNSIEASHNMTMMPREPIVLEDDDLGIDIGENSDDDNSERAGHRAGNEQDDAISRELGTEDAVTGIQNGQANPRDEETEHDTNDVPAELEDGTIWDTVEGIEEANKNPQVKKGDPLHPQVKKSPILATGVKPVAGSTHCVSRKRARVVNISPSPDPDMATSHTGPTDTNARLDDFRKYWKHELSQETKGKTFAATNSAKRISASSDTPTDDCVPHRDPSIYGPAPKKAKKSRWDA